MKRPFGYPSLALLCGFGLAGFTNTAVADNAINVGVGTTGLVLEVDSALTDTVHIRGSLQNFKYDEDFEEEGVDYEGEITSTHVGAIIDYHPFQGFFRLSAGLFVTDLAIELDASPSQTEFEIGDDVYIIGDGNNNPLQLSADIEFAPVSPYIGIGWGNSPGEGFGFTFDVGLLVVGEADLSFDASGTATEQDTGITIDVARNAEFQENLQQEQADLEEEFEDFSVYPVVTLGVSYTF